MSRYLLFYAVVTLGVRYFTIVMQAACIYDRNTIAVQHAS